MKKIGIVTLNGYFNYGNRLQNYALTKYLEGLGYKVYSIWDKDYKYIVKDIIRTLLIWNPRFKRYRSFYRFSKKYIKEIILKNKKEGFDYVIVGSDQVWNPIYVLEEPFLLYEPMLGEKVFSYAASFGTEVLPEQMENKYKDILKKYKAISTREVIWQDKLKTMLGRENIELVVDPTFLLTREEWDLIKRKPKKWKNSKYIVNYILGELENKENEAILNFAKENGCMIINLTNPNDVFYSIDPAEFLYLIENAFLVCTDSFHASVFSFIYDRPFVVFRRRGESDYMYSRISNLLTMFNLENREYNGHSISEENMRNNYRKSQEILYEERNKSKKYINKNIDLVLE